MRVVDKRRHQIEEALYDRFGQFEIPENIWSVLSVNGTFEAFALAGTEQGYLRCAYLAMGAIIMHDSTRGLRSKRSYEKPSARDKYRRMTHFAANAFRKSVVESVRLTTEQQERADRDGMMLLSTHSSFELRLGQGRTQQVIRRRPDWKAITQMWNEANPSERVASPETFHRYYNRFISTLGYVPKCNLSFADLSYILRGIRLLRIQAEMLRGSANIVRASDDDAFIAVMKPDDWKQVATEYECLASELDQVAIEADSDRFDRAIVQLQAFLSGDDKDTGTQ